jgi:hypothetical protein
MQFVLAKLSMGLRPINVLSNAFAVYLIQAKI